MKTIFCNFIFLAIFLASSFTAVTAGELPKSFYVKVDGSGDGLSWASASGNLQYAINLASAGDTVKVAAGEYKPVWTADGYNEQNGVYPQTDGGRDNSFVLKDGVIILGGYPANGGDARNRAENKTVLSGDIGVEDNYSDNSYHVVIGAAIGSGAALDGFTIIKGNANGSGNITVNSKKANRVCGGGIYNIEGSPSLKSLVISGNTASDTGGMENEYNSNPTVTNVLISGNTARQFGGGVRNHASSPSFINVTIYGNKENNGNDNMVNEGGSSPVFYNSIIGAGRNDPVSYSGSNNYCIRDNEASLSFVNPLPAGLNIGGDYRLLPSSCAVNGGDNSASQETLDLAGNPRVFEENIDIGAYECQEKKIWIAPEILTDALPQGTTGDSYYVGIQTNDPFAEWNISEGELPEGLEFLIFPEYGCVIEGVPVKNGEFTFTLKGENFAGTVEKQFTIIITAVAPKIYNREDYIIPRFIKNYDNSAGWGFWLTDETSRPVTWTLTGNLPNGIVWNSDEDSDNLYFSGIPTVSGEFPLKIKVENEGGADSLDIVFKIRESETDILLIPLYWNAFGNKTDSFQDAALGCYYDFGIDLYYDGGGEIEWSLSEGSLPAGIELRGYGILGVPTETGVFPFTIKVTTDYGSDSLSFSLTVKNPVIVNSAEILLGEGKARPAFKGYEYYSEFGLFADELATFVSNARRAPKAPENIPDWIIKFSGELPAGLYFRSGDYEGGDAQYGWIAGTPYETGEYVFKIQQLYLGNTVAEKTFTLNVSDYVSLPDAIVDEPYSEQFAFPDEISHLTYFEPETFDWGGCVDETGLISFLPAEIDTIDFILRGYYYDNWFSESYEIPCRIVVTKSTETKSIIASRTTVHTAGNLLIIDAVENVTVKVYSLAGQTLKTLDCRAGTTATALPAGIYIVRFSGESKKIVAGK
jgi:hypothetical protein